MDQQTAPPATQPTSGFLDNHALTYSGLISYLAELALTADFQRVEDLPPLEPEHVAAALEHCPGAFIDALADLDVTQRVIVLLLGNSKESRLTRHAHVGYAVTAAIGDYLRPMIWQDVQREVELRKGEEAIERDGWACDGLTATQQMACDFGLGRTLQS